MYRLGCRGAYGHCSGAKAATAGLKTLLALGSGLLILTLVAILGFVIEGPATRQIEMRIGADLQELAFQVHHRLHRELSERLQDVQLAATSGDLADPAASRLKREAWFHGGLQGAYLGALKASPTLAPAAGGEPGRFVDLAAPVVREGKLVGVL